MPIMTAALIVPMLLTVGGAVDLGLYEHGRIALQDALDRGVLAAAAMKQTEDATAVVKSYLKTIPNGEKVTLDVQETRTLNSRKVTATASLPYSTVFLGLIGSSNLDLKAKSTAEDQRRSFEISMVLDISGSMQDNGGIGQLRPAAKDFLDTVLTKDTKDTTSISIVPFAGQVNVGKSLFEHVVSQEYTRRPLPYPKRHDYSYCFDLLPQDFAAGLPSFVDREQTPHFSYYNINASAKKPWWCADGAPITYMTNDIAKLKAGVDALYPYDGTGTAYGMKWAELLLNPSMRPILSAVANKADVSIPASFRARPVAFDDKDTLKFIVLMTDGQIGFQPRPTDKAYSEILPKFPNKRESYVVTGDNISGWGMYVTSPAPAYSEGQAKSHYEQVCSYAKSEGITIFTIAFKVSDDTAATIARCASKPAYAYKVDGLDMGQAFKSIAATMQKIRITE
ncbi:TadE/TadG family type IV pilus assembly protein [Aureimonas ureilytica]|uniref:TadE/TadG family type IV pilus assembly protein n=1 Tax=Aureimonas ureilytica TaxID=401562 RepID=UPI00037423C7|nr:TadE/TadG family type IV pilus assembly protein [Aureimonas ureilytica]